MPTFDNSAVSEISEFCLEHMLRVLSDVEPELSPYPHFWATNIFPDEIYDRMVSEFPAPTQFPGPTDNEYHRSEMHLSEGNIEQFPRPTQDLWFAVQRVMGATRLKSAIFDRLAAGFAHRFSIPPESAWDITAYPRPMLYSETAGYAIAPHPDTRRKLATVQFAITEGEQQSSLGTSLYRLSANPADLLTAPRGFREVGQKPFIRNSVFAFSVVNTLTMRSWHGRDPLPSDCGVRRTLLQIYYSEARDANPELISDTMPNMEQCLA